MAAQFRDDDDVDAKGQHMGAAAAAADDCVNMESTWTECRVCCISTWHATFFLPSPSDVAALAFMIKSLFFLFLLLLRPLGFYCATQLRSWKLSLSCVFTGPPHISGSVTPRQTFRLGETIKLDCPIRGTPTPIVEWYKVNICYALHLICTTAPSPPSVLLLSSPPKRLIMSSWSPTSLP